MRSELGSLGHLARRFAGSLWPGGPAPAAEAWARSQLRLAEIALWERMSGPDRRHAVAVAQRLRGEEVAAISAALLHDVGKIDAGIGPWRRAAVTVAALAVGRERLARGSSRAARYLRHDALGADLLSAAGSDSLTVTWAREHHLPAARWTLPPDLGRALKAADDD